MTTTFYKATRLEGTDFWTGTVNYANALGGEPVRVPFKEQPNFWSDDVLHAFTEPTKALEFEDWPCRLFEVTGTPVEQRGSVVTFFELLVVREIDAHLALGPQGKEVAALLQRTKSITRREIEGLRSSYVALSIGSVDDAKHAQREAGKHSGIQPTVLSAKNAAGRFVCNAVGQYSWQTAQNAVGDAISALAMRHLIGQHHFTQEHYDTLTRPWRTAIGSIHHHDGEIDSSTSAQ